MSLESKEIPQVEVEEHRLNSFMKEALPHYLGVVFVATPFYAFILHNAVIEHGFLIWFSFDFLFLLVILTVYYIYYRKRETFNLAIASIPIVYFSFYSALSPWLFLDTDQSIYYFTLMVILFASIASSAYAFACYFRLIAFSLIVPPASLLLKVSYSDIEDRLILQIAICLTVISSISFYRHINQKMIQTIVLQLDNVQARIEAEQANKGKSQFLAAASHDIRQPLQAVNFFTSILQQRNENPNDMALFNQLQSSVDNMSELLNDLLDVSKLDTGIIENNPKHIDLNKLLKQLASDVQPQVAKKQLTLIIQDFDFVVYSDAILLERVVKNLLINAVQYTEQGQVEISAELKPDSQGVQQLQLHIADSGCGIAQESQKLIFDEFYQLHNPERDRKKGLGLGLSIVKRLCDVQGWKLSLSSAEGEGSTFSIVLPLGQVEKIEPVQDYKNLHVNLSYLQVLVIDDDVTICQSLVTQLQDWGAQAIGFEGESEACDYIKSSDWQPNFIISDYRLRDNKTGAQAITQVISLLPDPVPALIITGDTSVERIKEAQDSGYTVMHKPIKPIKLKAFIQQRFKSQIALKI